MAKRYKNIQEYLDSIKRTVLKSSNVVSTNNKNEYKRAIQTEVYNKYRGDYGRHYTLKNAVESDVSSDGNIVKITTGVNTKKLPCGKYVYGDYPFAYSLGREYSQTFGYDSRDYILDYIEYGRSNNIFKSDGAFHDERKFYEKAQENIQHTFRNKLIDSLRKKGMRVK